MNRVLTTAQISHQIVVTYNQSVREEVTELPKDLYIPPQALKVFLGLLKDLSICCCT